MINRDLNEQIVEQVSAIEDTRVLLGLMLEPQALQWMELDYSVRNRWGPQLSEEDRDSTLAELKDDFKTRYETAREAIEPTPAFRDYNVDLKDVPEQEEVQQHIADFQDGDYFQEVFGDIGEALWSIKLVPLECLVAYQSHVTTTAHREIPTADDGLLDLFQYCLPTDSKNFLHVDGRAVPDQSSTVRVVSRNPNINFVGPEIQSIEGRPAGNISVTFEVKARPNFIQVANFNDRYILKNGYHRCYQLLQAGEEYVPAVVRYAQDYTETGAAGSGWFPKGMILGSRPPLVRDFLTDAAVDLEMKSQNKMIRLHAEKMDVER